MGVYTQEKIGLIPQSIVRTLDRLRRQLLPEGRVLALEEFRISRLRTIVALQCLFILITVPVFVHFIGKGIVIKPSVQYFWNIQHNEIFLNSYQTKRAYYEMREFHNILFFESLTQDRSLNERVHLCQQSTSINPDSQPLSERFKVNQMVNLASQHESSFPTIIETTNLLSSESKLDDVEEQIKHKAVQLAVKYNQQSIEAITDFVGDVVTMITIRILLLLLKTQIVFLKAFLLECFYSLNDAKKSVLIFFVTDLLVGYHSPKGWQLLTESLLRHYGLPESRVFIKFLIAILPVLLDTLFKYWIFRHLNRTSPSTVVTYHALIE